MINARHADLTIRGGTIVTASSRYQADIAVEGGRIVQIGGDMTSDQVIDATDRLVLPGGLDMHVHLTSAANDDLEFRWVDDFASGTRAAAAGGVTTVGNMAFPLPGESPMQTIERTRLEADSKALIDYVVHPVILDAALVSPEELDLLRAAGHSSLKIFMILGNFEATSRRYLEVMQHASDRGMLCMVHCEDECIIGHLTERLVQQGRTGSEWYGASRPVFSEEVAVTRAIGFAEAADAPIYIVHLSSQAALEACHRARARGVPVYVETRPLYIHLTDEKLEESDGAKYIGAPPLRKRSDADALWNGIWAGDIQTFCTDHAPWNLDAKLDPSMNVATFRQGVADLETLLPMLFSEGVVKERISLHRFVEVTSTNAARLFGLFPRKGTIAVGSDADMVVWNPAETRIVDSGHTETASDYSPYEGWEVTGWPEITVSRGEIVFEDGRAADLPGRGRLVESGPTQML